MPFIPQQSFMISTLASGSSALQNLEVDGSGNYAPPHYTFTLYTQPLPLGDGTVRGGGWTKIVWHWDILTPTQRDWLRTFCPLMSSEVFIKTIQYDAAESYYTYSAVMVWPIDKEVHDAHRRTNFDIEFHRMVRIA